MATRQGDTSGGTFSHVTCDTFQHAALSTWCIENAPQVTNVVASGRHVLQAAQHGTESISECGGGQTVPPAGQLLALPRDPHAGLLLDLCQQRVAVHAHKIDVLLLGVVVDTPDELRVLLPCDMRCMRILD